MPEPNTPLESRHGVAPRRTWTGMRATVAGRRLGRECAGGFLCLAAFAALACGNTERNREPSGQAAGGTTHTGGGAGMNFGGSGSDPLGSRPGLDAVLRQPVDHRLAAMKHAHHPWPAPP